MTARDRKRSIEQGITKEQAGSRRAGRVQVHRVQPKAPTKNSKQDAAENARKAKRVVMAKPQGLSVEAQFMELRPAGCPVLDWWRLFTKDEDDWPTLVDEWHASVTTEIVYDGA